MTAQLLIGPLLRRVVGTRATIWVETTAPAMVRVETAGGAGGQARTFSAYGHHYALVVVSGLAPERSHTYRVLLDDRPVWPPPESPYPPSVIRTRAADDRDEPVTLVFGSCRQTPQHATARRLPPDALDAYAQRMMAAPDDRDRPDLLVLLGDQVYADETTHKVRRFLRRRRHAGHDSPADQVVTFDEYTKLYLESWREPKMRWLLATVPSVMIFDDHEIIDDWNASASWRADMAAQPWWAERITSGLASYWIYQHLGNLSPDEIAADPVFARVTAAGDATAVLSEFGAAVDTTPSTTYAVRPYRWSYALDIGGSRLVVLDNRCSRVLTPGRRAMLPPVEWQWFVDQAHGDYDHLVVGSSLPWLMPPAIHHLEACNERLADSRHPPLARLAEALRRTFDLEHWAAFGCSFEALAELFRRLGAGGPAAPRHRIGADGAYAAPATINVLSGDVHHSYVARAELGPDVRTPVHQLTCSPIHHQLPALLRPLLRFGWSRAAAWTGRGLARSAGLGPPALRWTRLAGPYFGNAVGTLRHVGRAAEMTLDGTTTDGSLCTVAVVALTATAQPSPNPTG